MATRDGALPPVTAYDAIVIGTGQAGKPLATALAGAGKRTLVVERGAVGGTCVNVGCTPTKTMVASARVASLAARARDFGVRTGRVTVDLAAVRRRTDALVGSFRDGGRKGLERTEGCTLVFGDGAFESREVVRVTRGRRLVGRASAPWIFINTGCRPTVPALPGLDTVPFLDSSAMLRLARLPRHLIVLGGGYIGCEFGQMFRRFGARVTLLARGPQLLSREDPDVAEGVAEVLRDDGIDVRLGADVRRVARGPRGAVRVTLGAGRGTRTLAGSHLLVAVGRRPNTETLGCEAAGIATDPRGYVMVNERLETSVPGIYALGDVRGGPAFTHISYDDYRIVERNLLGDGGATTTDQMVPYVVYIDPQLGRIGLTETEARATGRPVRVAKIPMRWVARALEMAEPRGFLKAVVERGTDQLLGAAALGVEGGELMSALQIAMMGRLPFPRLRDGIFAHPTLCEGFNTLFWNLEE